MFQLGIGCKQQKSASLSEEKNVLEVYADQGSVSKVWGRELNRVKRVCLLRGVAKSSPRGGPSAKLPKLTSSIPRRAGCRVCQQFNNMPEFRQERKLITSVTQSGFETHLDFILYLLFVIRQHIQSAYHVTDLF